MLMAAERIDLAAAAAAARTHNFLLLGSIKAKVNSAPRKRAAASSREELARSLALSLLLRLASNGHEIERA